MSATAKLYRVFLVEKQIRGLRSRLRTAERFLKQQEHQFGRATAAHTAAEGKYRRLRASILERENEGQTIDERINHLRAQMNEAKTNREYKAFLTEVNTFKAQKEQVEAAELELMTEAEELAASLEQLAADRAEREKLVEHARAECAERESEIKGRLTELEGKYAEARADAPADVLRCYDELLERNPDDDPMASVEINDRKRHIYTCTSCMIELPKEAVSALLSHGGMTRCPSCDVILYLEEDAAEALAPR